MNIKTRKSVEKAKHDTLKPYIRLKKASPDVKERDERKEENVESMAFDYLYVPVPYIKTKREKKTLNSHENSDGIFEFAGKEYGMDGIKKWNTKSLFNSEINVKNRFKAFNISSSSNKEMNMIYVLPAVLVLFLTVVFSVLVMSFTPLNMNSSLRYQSPYSDEKVFDAAYLNQYLSQSAVYSGFKDTDIVRVARKEIGNRGGYRYYSWYGFRSRVSWCACFVSWCLYRSGKLKGGKYPKFSYVQNGLDWFKARNRFRPGGSIPNSGNIIFFDWDHNGTANHVGIVQHVEGGYVYTIEGNSSDRVRECRYYVTSSSIMGYGL